MRSVDSLSTLKKQCHLHTYRIQGKGKGVVLLVKHRRGAYLPSSGLCSWLFYRTSVCMVWPPRTCTQDCGPVYLLLPSQDVHVYDLPTIGRCTFEPDYHSWATGIFLVQLVIL